MFSIKAQNAGLRKFSVTGVAQLSFQAFGQWEAARKTAKEKNRREVCAAFVPCFFFLEQARREIVVYSPRRPGTTGSPSEYHERQLRKTAVDRVLS